ncbi:MAG: hypothetical protein DHS20C11_18530 [Lysobacteraceae bacterium]|nr:MAG: hypothetical protein DHS20C11_18530 [Xanthomonadaceae bacterium]
MTGNASHVEFARRTSSCVVLILLLAGSALGDSRSPAGAGADYQLRRAVVANGGMPSESVSFELHGTIGQFEPGPTLEHGTTAIRGGFWAGINNPVDVLFKDGFAP